jgi:hypothetical protein
MIIRELEWGSREMLPRELLWPTEIFLLMLRAKMLWQEFAIPKTLKLYDESFPTSMLNSWRSFRG